MELCRCGQSANKPFCDGTHAAVDFDGTLAN
jgi:CDGSH-type Zn-finger protein